MSSYLSIRSLSTSLAPGTDIRLRNISTSSEGVSRPRPRGTGKLLTSINGVGLALLRLEHMLAVEKEGSQFYLDAPSAEPSEATSLSVTPWRPDWWPELRPATE